MTDTRFKWLTGCATIAVVAIAAMYFFAPDKEPQAQPEDIADKYVYIDQKNIIHTSRKCSRLNYKGMKSTRIKTEDIIPVGKGQLCPKCVSDREYEQLTEIVPLRNVSLEDY